MAAVRMSEVGEILAPPNIESKVLYGDIFEKQATSTNVRYFLLGKKNGK